MESILGVGDENYRLALIVKTRVCNLMSYRLAQQILSEEVSSDEDSCDESDEEETGVEDGSNETSLFPGSDDLGE